jgi:hypothetical protein
MTGAPGDGGAPGCASRPGRGDRHAGRQSGGPGRRACDARAAAQGIRLVLASNTLRPGAGRGQSLGPRHRAALAHGMRAVLVRPHGPGHSERLPPGAAMPGMSANCLLSWRGWNDSAHYGLL